MQVRQEWWHRLILDLPQAELLNTPVRLGLAALVWWGPALRWEGAMAVRLWGAV